MTPTQTGDKPMVTRELLTCPFCDGEADFGTRPYKNSLWSIHCSGCTAYRVGQTRAEAIAAWNTRAQETLSPEQPDERPCLHCNGTDPHCSVCEGVGTLPVFCEPLDTIQRLGQEFDGEQPRLGREAVRDAIHDAIVSAYRQGALDVHNEWIKLDLDDGLSDDPDFTEAAHDHAASEMPGLGAVIAALTFEPDVVFCERCQGNGELVTDWDRYMKGDMDASGEEYVEPCPDCEGEGHRTRPASPEASPSLGMGEALRIARETIQIERDHLVSCCTLNGDRDTLEEGAKPDVERMEYALAAIDAALSPSPDLAEENERLREYLADCVAQDVATRIEREFQGFWAKEDLIEEIPGLIREAILARSTIQTISTGNP